MVNTNQDEYYPSIAVAAVDLLGINTLLDNADESTSAMKALSLLRTNASVKEYCASPSLSDAVGSLYATEGYFSDAVYFFADPKLGIGKQIDLLACKCASLILVGLMLTPGFLLRAGIAVGDLRKKTISTGEGSQELRIGTAMANAHALEEAQEWIGGATQGGFPGMTKDINRISYPVPLKPDPKYASFQETEAINWVYQMALNSHTKADVIDKVKRGIDFIGNKNGEQDGKLVATIEFVEYVFSHPDCLRG